MEIDFEVMRKAYTEVAVTVLGKPRRVMEASKSKGCHQQEDFKHSFGKGEESTKSKIC